MTPRISLIVAVAKNGVIGAENALPWRIPEDLKHFKAITLGKPVIMGRKTWESLGRPLPGRTNIVISRLGLTVPEGVRVATSLEDALAIAQETAQDEIMIIGGAQIYALALPKADRIYLTDIDAVIPGDATFPALDPKDWTETSREDREQDAPTPMRYAFCTFDRCTP